MKHRARVVVLASSAVLLLVILLAFFLLDSRTFLLPYKAFRIIYSFFRQFPTSIYWITALGVAGVILVVGFARTWGRHDHYTGEDVARASAGKLAPLADRLRLSPTSAFSLGCVVSELCELAVRVVAHRRGVPPPEARKLVRSGAWTDKPSVNEFLAHAGRESDSPETVLRQIEDAVAHLEQYSD